MKACQVTVFTPTYNRKRTLQRLYDSLRNQTIKPLEWIIVDDGSTDETFNLVFPWIEAEEMFNIIYLRVKNGGKHRGINKASDLAKGDLFCIVDSDDYLTSDAIEKIISWEQTIQGKVGYAGVSGNKGFSDKQLIGTTFDGNYIDATSLEREKYHIDGDKAEVFYTKILKKYKFPEIEGENFMTECVVWFRIAADDLKIRWFNEIIYVANYLEDGLTRNAGKLIKNNPKGIALSDQLNKKYYQTFVSKEKIEVMKVIKQLLFEGNLSSAINYLDHLTPRVKNDIEIQLLMAQLYIYDGNDIIAKEILKRLVITHPNEMKVYLKLANIEEAEQNLSSAFSYYQKALLYLDDEENNDFFDKLKKQYHFTQHQMNQIMLKNAKKSYENKDINQSKQLILRNPILDENYRLELCYFFNNEQFVNYIIPLILNFNDISFLEQDRDYVRGHLLFNQGDYDQSLGYLLQVSSKKLTPLTLYRVTFILKLKDDRGAAEYYDSLYQRLCQQLKSTGQIYFVENRITPSINSSIKFRNDINTIFKQVGFKFVNQSFNGESFNFSVFDRIFFQYPFMFNEEELFNNCCALNIKTFLVIHELNDSLDVSSLNQASAIIVTHKNLQSVLVENRCYCPIIVLEHLDYLMNTELQVPTLSKKVVLVNDEDILSQLSEQHQFTLNVYGNKKQIKREDVVYKGEFDFEQLPFQLEGSFGLLPTHTDMNSWQLSLYLLAKLPLICFESSEIANFVLEHKLGFVISTLDEIDSKLHQISNEQYEEMIQKITPYTLNISSGFYFKKALDMVLK